MKAILPPASGTASAPPARPRSDAARVAAARDRAARRLDGTPWQVNADVPGEELRRLFPLAPGALAPMDRAVALGQVSSRAADRILAVPWTLADLADLNEPGLLEATSALQLWLGSTP